MKSLSLTSLVLASLFSSTLFAEEQPTQVTTSALIATAYANIDLKDVLPENDAHEDVKAQSLASLARKSAQVAEKSLIAMQQTDVESDAE